MLLVIADSFKVSYSQKCTNFTFHVLATVYNMDISKQFEKKHAVEICKNRHMLQFFSNFGLKNEDVLYYSYLLSVSWQNNTQELLHFDRHV